MESYLVHDQGPAHARKHPPPEANLTMSNTHGLNGGPETEVALRVTVPLTINGAGYG